MHRLAEKLRLSQVNPERLFGHDQHDPVDELVLPKPRDLGLGQVKLPFTPATANRPRVKHFTNLLCNRAVKRLHGSG